MVPRETTEWTLRPAGVGDLSDVAEVFLASRAAAVPHMPPVVHTDDEVRAHIGGFDLAVRDLWVAEHESRVCGFAELQGEWLDDLYVHPEWAGQGVGGALLDVAKSLRPNGFCLWVFASNTPARAFYSARGLVELEHTDGSGNEEGAPDVRLAWPGTEPLGFYRRLIDAIDDELADLLARRMALTHAVQEVKPVSGHSGRDASRERQIAVRMAQRTGLPVEVLQPIMHTVIEESLTHYESVT